MPVFFLDASGSISEEMVEEMLTALRLTAEFSDAVAYVFDEITRGPILAGDTERLREAIADAGGGTRLAGAWDDVAERIDLELVVIEAVSVGIDKNFKVIVFEHDCILLGDCSPNVRLLQFGAYIEEAVVPTEAHAGIEPGV